VLQATRREGFTLIEVMVSVVILAIGMVLVIESLQGAFNAVEVARDTTRLTLLARELLEETGAALSAGDRGAARSGSGALDPPWQAYRWDRRITTEQPPGPALDASRAGTLYRVEIELGRGDDEVLHRLVSYVWQAPEEMPDGD